MDPDTVLRVAHEQAMQYPSVAVGHPFGPEYTVYKVRDKMFMMAYELRGTPSLNLKIDPLDGEVLRDAYAEITPGYHMNKLHWITDRKSTRLNSSHVSTSYAVLCLKKK